MEIDFSGFRRVDLRHARRLPARIMFTYEDIGPRGGGEQRKLFQLLWEHRDAVKNKTTESKLPGKLEDLQVGCVRSHFLDSGSFSLVSEAAKYAKANGKDRFAYYYTPQHREYLGAYATFVKQYSVAIDYYANVDVIGNPELTWRNQQYLEKAHGLTPVPVVHYGSDLKWLHHYLDRGYPFIALGGLVGADFYPARDWVDRVFAAVCDTPNRLPSVKIHGFGVTSHPMMIRYPWWSVDSASWTKIGAYGGILVPHKRRGVYDFSEAPYVIAVSAEAPKASIIGQHLNSMGVMSRENVLGWLKEINVPLGINADDGSVLEYGVINRHSERKAANLLFFERLAASLPEWPWPFLQPAPCEGFGL